jgi:hypothetical protein
MGGPDSLANAGQPLTYRDTRAADLLDWRMPFDTQLPLGGTLKQLHSPNEALRGPAGRPVRARANANDEKSLNGCARPQGR